MIKVHSMAKNCAFVEYTNGVFVKLALPPMHSSSLVSRCLTALKTSITNQEACLTLLSRWYQSRNAPGSSSTSNAYEWELFAKCLLGLLGYHTDSINFKTEEGLGKDDSSLSPPESSKKRKQADNVRTTIIGFLYCEHGFRAY